MVAIPRRRRRRRGEPQFLYHHLRRKEKLIESTMHTACKVRGCKVIPDIRSIFGEAELSFK